MALPPCGIRAEAGVQTPELIYPDEPEADTL